jgi:hypothetical protein
MAEVLAEGGPSNRPPVRRKFGEQEDILLLKEVVANGAHIVRRGSQCDKFDEVATSLNANSVMPWNTDGKHCIDRYKLLISTFRRADRARAATSGAEEEFGEKDQLLSDICSAIDDADERGRLERREASRRDAELRYAGEQVRAAAMSRRTNAGDSIAEEDAEVENNAQEIVEAGSRDIHENAPRVRSGSDSPSTIPEIASRKKRKRPFDLEDVLLATEERRADQEGLRLKLETERLDYDRQRAAALEKNEERRLNMLEIQQEFDRKEREETMKLQSQQQGAHAAVQMKMMSVLEQMLKKLDG